MYEKGKSVVVYGENNEGFVWENMTTNLSKYTNCFSDFGWPDNTADFPKSTEVCDYSISYYKYFLANRPNIIYNFQTNVKHIRRKADRYVVSTDTETNEFSHVAICSGFFNEKNVPDEF
eukprot:UN28689